MSFVSRFVNQTRLPPVQKIVNNVVNKVASGAKTQISSVASSISESLTNKGQSYESVLSVASQKVDSIVAGGSADYTGFAGKDSARASTTDISNLRDPSALNARSYSTEVSPQGRVQSVHDASTDTYDIYPPDMGKYSITFDFVDYRRPAAFARPNINTVYSVTLPIPGALVEQYGARWDTAEAELIGDIADAFIRGTGENFSGAIQEIGDAAGSAASGLISNTLRAARAVLNPTIVDVAEQTLGGTPNPNITALFKGPSQFRTHRFSWDFSPRTPAESLKIQKIIKSIKNKALPRAYIQNTASLLAYPKMVNIRLAPIELQQQILPFKLSVVTDISVQYSLSGVPSFFANSKLPTFVRLSLELKEIEYFLSEDEATLTPENVRQFGANLLGGLNTLSDAALGVATGQINQFPTGDNATPPHGNLDQNDPGSSAP